MLFTVWLIPSFGRLAIVSKDSQSLPISGGIVIIVALHTNWLTQRCYSEVLCSVTWLRRLAYGRVNQCANHTLPLSWLMIIHLCCIALAARARGAGRVPVSFTVQHFACFVGGGHRCCIVEWIWNWQPAGRPRPFMGCWAIDIHTVVDYIRLHNKQLMWS